MFGLSLPSIVCRRTRVLLFGVFFVAPNGVLHYLTIWVPWRVSYNCLPFAVFDGIRVARLFLVSCVVLCFEFLLGFFFVLCIMCQMLSGMKLLTRTFIYQLQTTIDHVVSITNEMWLTGQQFGLQIMREFKSAKLFMMDLLRYSNDFCAIVSKCRRVPLVEQELLTLPEYLSSPPGFGGVHGARSLDLYVCFVDRCLFSFGHCVVCSSSIYVRILRHPSS
jgi:hypothetical protein